ncbi:MAG TPA: AsmA family protein [Candidatus Limnocylindria bacterium]|nr:AsmA family protein [Candidatus Limnocylindria bacterium]
MKTFFRWAIRLFVTLFFLVLVLAVIGVLLKDEIAKSLAERNLRANTGMDAKIEKMDVGLATPTVSMEGLKIYNTADFGGGTFLEMPELRIEYVPGDIRDGKLRFKTVRLNLTEVHIVRNKSGKTNIELMEKETKKKSSGQKGKSNVPGIDFGGIDTLYLTIGRIRITDERDPRNNEVINLGIKEQVGRNLKTEADVERWFVGVMFTVATRELTTGPKASLERTRLLLRLFGVRL